MVSMDSIPEFFDSHTHEHPFPSHLATLGSPIKQASKVPATCLTLTTLPMPHTHLFPTQTSNLPALHPAVFDQPTSQPESPPIIIKVIKQLPSQAYTNVLLLDKSKCNCDLWNQKLCIILEGCGLDDYAFGFLVCPSTPQESISVWVRNNKLTHSFILSCCSDEEQHLLEDVKSAASAYTFLKGHHEHEGAYTQLILIQEVFAL